LARVVKPGGQMVSLEFGVPRGVVLRSLWMGYTGLGLPLLTLPLGRGWRRVGRFLGWSIWEFDRQWPVSRQVEAWQKAGLGDMRVKRLSLGGAVLMEGTRDGARGAESSSLAHGP
jgi:ubiquinone/menaquinone biosynthesis C-methylase UbiE